MFGMEKDDEMDPKAQVLQEILDYAREKMVGGMKSKEGEEAPEGEMSIEISKSSESPEGMEAESATEGDGLKTCPHCGKPC